MRFQTLTLQSIRARPIVLKLKRPVVARIATLADWPLILIDLHTEEGVIGRSYLEPYLPKSMRYLIPALHDLGEMLKGRRVAPIEFYEAARKSLHFVGYEGMSMAIVRSTLGPIPEGTHFHHACVAQDILPRDRAFGWPHLLQWRDRAGFHQLPRLVIDNPTIMNAIALRQPKPIPALKFSLRGRSFFQAPLRLNARDIRGPRSGDVPIEWRRRDAEAMRDLGHADVGIGEHCLLIDRARVALEVADQLPADRSRSAGSGARVDRHRRCCRRRECPLAPQGVVAGSCYGSRLRGARR